MSNQSSFDDADDQRGLVPLLRQAHESRVRVTVSQALAHVAALSKDQADGWLNDLQRRLDTAATMRSFRRTTVRFDGDRTRVQWLPDRHPGHTGPAPTDISFLSHATFVKTLGFETTPAGFPSPGSFELFLLSLIVIRDYYSGDLASVLSAETELLKHATILATATHIAVEKKRKAGAKGREKRAAPAQDLRRKVLAIIDEIGHKPEFKKGKSLLKEIMARGLLTDRTYASAARFIQRAKKSRSASR